MPSKDTRILDIIQYQKSHKATFASYADIEFSIEKIDECKNTLKIHPQQK